MTPSAEGQLEEALPKMVKARTDSLRFALEHHLEETKEQVERLKEVFGLVGALMTQLARELMSESRTGLTKEPKRARVMVAAEDDE